MEADQMWSFLPGILTSYDGTKGNVRPLVKLRYKDGSAIDFPEVQEVQVITPGTAFAGMNLPVRVGDKVCLHIADRDIQKLLYRTTTAGLADPGSAVSATQRKHNLTDAIAYTGFASHDSVNFNEEYQYDVWVFNNLDSDSYNHVRLKQNGDIEVKTLKATVTLEKQGDIRAENDIALALLQNSGNIEFSNDNITANLQPGGQATITNTLETFNMPNTGNVTITSPLTINLNTAEVICSAELSILGGAIKMSSHTHGGVEPGPSNTDKPNNPS